MNYPQVIYHVRCAVCVLVLAMITNGCVESVVREPELPGNSLTQSQFSVLPSGWIYEPMDERNIWTDSDFTRGVWAIWTGFSRDDPHEGKITVEVHTFTNQQLARRIQWPSPIADIEDVEWDYKPAEADEFIVKCEEPQLQHCVFNMRYEEYRVLLRIPIGEYVSGSDVNHLLDATDEFMQNYLANSVTSVRSRDSRPTPNVAEILR